MISVIIPCKNRIESLTNCLNSILKSISFAEQKNKIEYEIIVVNDNSEIGFKEKFESLFPDICILDSNGIGPGYARNYGFQHSKGNFVFFTDSDCTVDDEWIYQGYRAFSNTNTIVIQGVPWLFQKNSNKLLGEQEEKLYKVMFSSYITHNKSVMTDSRNLLINKSLMNKVGNDIFSTFSEDATAESRVFAHLCISNGINVSWNDKLKVYHEDPLNIMASCKQKFRHGKGRLEIWKTQNDFNFIKHRYFDIPILNGIDKEYVIPAHFAFLYGYYKFLNNGEEMPKYENFINTILDEYQCNLQIIEFIKFLKSEL